MAHSGNGKVAVGAHGAGGTAAGLVMSIGELIEAEWERPVAREVTFFKKQLTASCLRNEFHQANEIISLTLLNKFNHRKLSLIDLSFKNILF